MADIQVRRANVILTVPEEQKGEYLAKGFDVLAEDGTVSEACVPNDINVLKKAYVEHLAKIKELEAKIAGKATKVETVKAEATPKKEPTAKTTSTRTKKTSTK